MQVDTCEHSEETAASTFRIIYTNIAGSTETMTIELHGVIFQTNVILDAKINVEGNINLRHHHERFKRSHISSKFTL